MATMENNDKVSEFLVQEFMPQLIAGASFVLFFGSPIFYLVSLPSKSMLGAVLPTLLNSVLAWPILLAAIGIVVHSLRIYNYVRTALGNEGEKSKKDEGTFDTLGIKSDNNDVKEMEAIAKAITDQYLPIYHYPTYISFRRNRLIPDIYGILLGTLLSSGAMLSAIGLVSLLYKYLSIWHPIACVIGCIFIGFAIGLLCSFIPFLLRWIKPNMNKLKLMWLMCPSGCLGGIIGFHRQIIGIDKCIILMVLGLCIYPIVVRKCWDMVDGLYEKSKCYEECMWQYIVQNDSQENHIPELAEMIKYAYKKNHRETGPDASNKSVFSDNYHNNEKENLLTKELKLQKQK